MPCMSMPRIPTRDLNRGLNRGLEGVPRGVPRETLFGTLNRGPQTMGLGSLLRCSTLRGYNPLLSIITIITSSDHE